MLRSPIGIISIQFAISCIVLFCGSPAFHTRNHATRYPRTLHVRPAIARHHTFVRPTLRRTNCEYWCILVHRASDDISYVWNTSSSAQVQRRVSIFEFQYSCPFVDERRLPCQRLIAALSDRGVLASAVEGFHVCHKVQTCATGFHYQAVTILINDKLEDDTSCLPPASS